MPINLGLCCMNTKLRTKGVFSSRTCRLDTVKKEGNGFEHLKKLSMQNLDDLLKLLDWNKENGIKVFRMSSELFPHISNYTLFVVGIFFRTFTALFRFTYFGLSAFLGLN